MNMINMSQNLDEIVAKHDLRDIASLYKNDFAITKTNELQKVLDEIEDEGRVLKIGVVGRVKAGKSSLLNALIFDGKNVLPKAATPMTAALTILEYGEETKAVVDFFNQEDIDDIKKDYDRYLSELEYIKDKKYEELKERHLRKQVKESKKKQSFKEKTKEILTEVFAKEDVAKLQEKSLRQAKNELKSNDRLVSAYDQYTRIKDAGVSVGELAEFQEICADTMEELNTKLYDFVGANGKYMPFTKSVTLQLNEEKLKEIQIIDTPGVNDPVTSREERTKELLKYCDVVLIVSPSGQFLSSEDMELFDRITTKEGVKEVYIISSQVDLQLFGGEKESGQGILPKVLNNIADNLTTQMKTVFTNDEYLKENPTFNALLNKKILYSSGIAYALLKKFDDKETWDSNEKHVWKMLNEHYKDFFDDENTAKENLKLLGNIQNIQEVLDEVKLKKEEILQSKKENFIKSKSKSLLEYRDALHDEIKDKIHRVENSDIEKIKEQKSTMQVMQKKVSVAVTDEYSDILDTLEIDIKSILNDKLNSYFKKSKRDIIESEGTETESYEVSTSSWYNPFSYGNTKTKSSTHTTVKAGFVRNSLDDLTDEIENTIDIDAKQFLLAWRKDLPKSIIFVLRREAGDENLEISLISQTIRKVVNTVEYPEIDYGGGLPSSLRKSGTLKAYEAETFIDEASNYVSELRIRVKKDIKSYIDNLLGALKEVDISYDIFKNYINMIEELENAIENKELMLEKYHMIMKDLEMIDA